MLLMLITDEKRELMSAIESLREEMIRIGIIEGLTSQSTITLSQKLDEYIAKYQALLSIKP